MNSNNILYLVIFSDDSANFYEEVTQGYVKPLLETKKIDVNKIMEKCSNSFTPLHLSNADFIYHHSALPND